MQSHAAAVTGVDQGERDRKNIPPGPPGLGIRTCATAGTAPPSTGKGSEVETQQPVRHEPRHPSSTQNARKGAGGGAADVPRTLQGKLPGTVRAVRLTSPRE